MSLSNAPSPSLPCAISYAAGKNPWGRPGGECCSPKAQEGEPTRPLTPPSVSDGRVEVSE